MDKNQLKIIIEESLSQLKDFQQKTLDNVYNKLYVDGEKKHLVADEVGLGKTIVAKGLIAKVLLKYIETKSDKPLQVVYICSNQALAAQNLRKLNILKDTDNASINMGRLIFQAYKNKNKKAFQLTSLTPSTSFRLIRGSGIQEERLLIYTILSKYKVFNSGRRDNGLKLTLIGYVEDPHIWKWRCDNHKLHRASDIRTSVYRKLKNAVKDTIVDRKKFHIAYEELNLEEPHSLQDILIKYSELLRVNNVKNYWGNTQLLSLIRGLLTEVCLEYIDADLYILDEFQRFKDLIDTNGKDFDDLTEAAAIAQKIFEKEGSKVLMLSATPFKQYSTKQDDENEEGHYKEFKTVLKFLIENDAEIEDFTKNRKKFFELLRRPETILFDDEFKLQEQLLAKNELEKLYRKVISRTERLIVSDDKNTLVKLKLNRFQGENPLNIKRQDIDDFVTADSLIKVLSEATNSSFHNIIGYVLSCPYPFSFMDNYKVKKKLLSNKKNPIIIKAIMDFKKGWLNWNEIQDYKAIKNLPNGKMRCLLHETIETGIWKQLWIAPSLPYYNLNGAFLNSENNSKTLLFSKWVMVPKMVGSILSYEAERLTLGDKRTLHKGEEPRVYTQPMGKTKRQPRRPTKILAIQMQKEKVGSMSAFTMLYPCLTFGLREEFHPINNTKLETPLNLIELKDKIKEKLNTLIVSTNIKKFCSIEKTTKNWYWAAPILLDKALYPSETKEAIEYVNWNSLTFINSHKHSVLDDDFFEIGAAGKHFDELKKLYYNPGDYQLGKMPDDLVEVLVEIVLGSPAISILRTLTHYFPDETISKRFVSSLDISYEFHSLFDKPESISIIQLNAILNRKRKKINNNVYWIDVLGYCIDGNLQSVLDEYGHLVFSDNYTLESFVNRFYNTVNINTTNVRVDSAESFLNDESKVMRCHFAVDFGNQDMDKDEGIKRISNVLDNFNSPFRPFVLASTSIGQEGLDFHYYCRKIVHWNLPSNPIDFEQREGRVNRYKGLVIRQNLVKKYRKYINENTTDVWECLFNVARREEGEGENPKSQLVPYWHVEGDDIFIERIIPALPYSKEISQLKHLLATLTIYRLTFGQPRQEELVESLFKGIDLERIDEIRAKLMIDLSPISYMD